MRLFQNLIQMQDSREFIFLLITTFSNEDKVYLRILHDLLNRDPLWVEIPWAYASTLNKSLHVNRLKLASVASRSLLLW